MNVHLAHSPVGRHVRPETLWDNACHALLRLLGPPVQAEVRRREGAPRRDDWHAVACAIGDLVEDFFAIVAIAATVGIGVVLVLAVAWLLPWWALGGGLIVAGLAVAGRRLRLAVADLERIVDEEASR